MSSGSSTYIYNHVDTQVHIWAGTSLSLIYHTSSAENARTFSIIDTPLDTDEVSVLDTACVALLDALCNNETITNKNNIRTRHFHFDFHSKISEFSSNSLMR